MEELPVQAIANTIAQSFAVGLKGPSPEPEELELITQVGIGAVVVFSRNISSPLGIWEFNYGLRRAAAEAGKPPLMVMVDQEGGVVARLREPFTCAPGFDELGASASEQQMYEHGLKVGRELKAAGFTWNLAPVVDVHLHPDGVMARRSLGSDPHRVARLAAAYTRGLRAGGVMACAKHFPGLGRTTADTHHRPAVINAGLEELEQVELVPFRAVVDAGAEGVMVSHAIVPALDPDRPGSLCPQVTGWLRRELGGEVVVLSDDMEMAAATQGGSVAQAAVEAYLAGCDMVLVCSRAEEAVGAIDELTRMASEGSLPLGVIKDKWARILRLKSSLAPLPPPAQELMELLGGGDGGD